MTKQSFVNRLIAPFLSSPAPARPETEPSAIQRLEQKLDRLLALLEAQAPSQANGQGSAGADTSAGTPDEADLPALVADLADQVRKQAKTQFKTNALQESQAAQQQETLETLRAALDRQTQLVTQLAGQQQQAIETAQLDWLKSLLPVLDSLDAAFESGRRQVLWLGLTPEARRALIGWLDGIRLARLRLLDLLAAQQVTPIPTVGRPFDPHRHVAAATDASGHAPDGTIVGEDRRGYATPDKVLRFAEVVVARAGK